MLVYFRHERCVVTRVLCMDKVNFNCVVVVFYPVMTKLEHQLAADLLHGDQYPVNRHLNTAVNTQIHIYIYIHFPRSRLSTAQLIRKMTFPELITAKLSNMSAPAIVDQGTHSGKKTMSCKDLQQQCTDRSNT